MKAEKAQAAEAKWKANDAKLKADAEAKRQASAEADAAMELKAPPHTQCLTSH